MSQENVRLVREAFQAFLAGDQEKTAQLVDPEVEFRGTVGGLQEGQTAHGQAEIDETFEGEDLEAWEERRLEAEEFIDAGDDVVVLLHEYRRGRGSGVELEGKTAVVVFSEWRTSDSHPGLPGSRRGPRGRWGAGVAERRRVSPVRNPTL